MITGRTRLIAHLGYPTEGFKAPMIYNPWFAAKGIDAVVVPMGVTAASYAAVLPALFQLHPQIALRHEEDLFDLSASGGDGKGWAWLVVAGRVYLVSPGKEVYYSRDVTALLDVYLVSRPHQTP